MFSTIREWFKIVNLPPKIFFTLLGLIVIEIGCYIFAPISFANIVASVSNQDYDLSLLWTIINFLVQILNILITLFKKNTITKTHSVILSSIQKTKTKNNEKLISKSITSISNYIFTLNTFLLFGLKLLAIIIVSSIYSIYLMAYIIASILICMTVSISLKAKTFTKNILLDVLWSIFTLIITIVIINLISDQKITLTIFLLLSTFINTHLLKPNFDVGFIIETKNLKAELNTYIKFSKIK